MTTVVLVGSSIFEAWTGAGGIAPGRRLVNRAVGGTITRYWVEHLPGLLAADCPDALGFYCGSNDVNQGVPEPEILDHIARCREMAGAIPFAYFGIIKAPQKAGKFGLIDRLNARVRGRLCAADLYVELNDLLCPAGRPMREYYLSDGLHMTEDAYAAITRFVRPAFTDWLAGLSSSRA